jgi:hypothetical protein
LSLEGDHDPKRDPAEGTDIRQLKPLRSVFPETGRGERTHLIAAGDCGSCSLHRIGSDKITWSQYSNVVALFSHPALRSLVEKISC